MSKSGETREGSGLGAVGVNDIGLKLLNDRMESAPGTEVTELGAMRDAKVADRPATRKDPLHQLGEAFATANVRIGQGNLLTGSIKKLG